MRTNESVDTYTTSTNGKRLLRLRNLIHGLDLVSIRIAAGSV
jgi:hypothetical protein